jgi:SAM-dependent methyltransferase
MENYSWPAVERRTREWLAERLREGIQRGYERRAGVFAPDGQPTRLDRYQFQLLQRKLKIFRVLDGLTFESFADVGAGFEDYPRLVRERYGVAAMYVDMNHQANLPLDGFPSDRLDRAVTASLTRLPFFDGAFDVVLCSEVLEHLVRPVEALAELRRVARKAVILTSLEAFAPRRLRRWWLHYRVDVTVPHVERNFFSLHDLRALCGDGAHLENLLDSSTLPASLIAPRADQDAAYARLRDTDALVDALCAATSSVEPLGRDRAGMVVTLGAGPAGQASALRVANPGELAAWLVAHTAAIERERLSAMERYAFIAGTIARRAPGLGPGGIVPHVLALAAPPADRPVSAALLSCVCCPDCRVPLAPHASGLACTACPAEFTATYGVPVLYAGRLPADAELEATCCERLSATTFRRRRAIRRIMRRLRRNERPPSRLRRAIWALVDAGQRGRNTPR